MNIFKGTSWWIIAPMIIVLIVVFFSVLFFSFRDPHHERIKRIANMERKVELSCIRHSIEDYYNDKDHYPTSLSELEKFLESESIKDSNHRMKPSKNFKIGEYYLYAHYPLEEPNFYHLGVILEIEDDTSLNDDADFNSKIAGYVNGFDGKDPIFDIHYK